MRPSDLWFLATLGILLALLLQDYLGGPWALSTQWILVFLGILMFPLGLSGRLFR